MTASSCQKALPAASAAYAPRKALATQALKFEKNLTACRYYRGRINSRRYGTCQWPRAVELTGGTRPETQKKPSSTLSGILTSCVESGVASVYRLSPRPWHAAVTAGRDAYMKTHKAMRFS